MSDQIYRSLALDPKQSFIVQAPAGSGKTELLTQRFLKLLSCVEHAPEEILAVTFTRKAAAQMRNRILNALQNAKLQISAPQKEHERVTWDLACQVLKRDSQLQWQLQQNPNRLRIVTIDALCAYIVSRMPILSQCGANIEIVDFAKRYYRQAVESLLVQTTFNEKWAASLTCLLKHLDNRIETIAELLVTMLSKRDQWLPHLAKINYQHIETYLNECLSKIIETHLETLRKRLIPYESELIPLLNVAAKECEKHGENGIRHCVNLTCLPEPVVWDLTQWEGIVELLTTGQNTWRKAFNQKVGFLSPSEAKDKTDKALRKLQKENIQALVECLSQEEFLLASLVEVKSLPPRQLTDSQIEILNALGELLPVLVAYLQITFQEAGKVDFIEVGLRATDALGDELTPSDIALSLDYQFRHILIDEYQDTSVMQYRLFEKLVMGWQNGDGKTLFLVGDPMQSIYRFRGAEVSLFLQTQQHGLGGVKLTPLTLQVNFRSNKNIIAWINKTFIDVFPHEEEKTLGAVSYSLAVAHQGGIDSKGVNFHPIFNKESQTDQILRLIKDALAQNPEENIAVLVRAKKHLSALIHELKQTNISFIAHEVEHLESRHHVIDLLSLLRAISDWSDTIAWYAILRAPWLGLTLSDLFIIKENNHTKIVWQTLLNFEQLQGLSLQGKNRLRQFVPVLANWMNNRQRRNVSQFLRGLWIALGGPYCYSQPDFLNDVNKTLDLIEEYALGGYIQDIDSLFSRMSELYGDISPGTQGTSIDEKRGIVELMTIHKAKGLEFDTVIMPHLQARTVNHEQALLLWLERSHYEGVDLILATKRAHTEEFDPLYRYVDKQIRKKNEYEAARLLYVGATRARSTLHLIGDCGDLEKEPPSGSFFKMLWPHIKEEVNLQSKAVRTQMSSPQSDIFEVQDYNLKRLPEDWKLPDPIQKKIAYQLQTKVSLSPNIPQNSDILFKSAGIVFHRILHSWAHDKKRYDILPERTKTACQMALKRMGLQDDILHDAYLLVIQALENMLQDINGRWILDPRHRERRSEWHLSVKSSKSIDNVIIDYAFVDQDDVRWIVDYKLTHAAQMNENALHREIIKYQEQLLQYQKILMSIETNRSVRCGLYFPLAKTWWEMKSKEICDIGSE